MFHTPHRRLNACDSEPRIGRAIVTIDNLKLHLPALDGSEIPLNALTHVTARRKGLLHDFPFTDKAHKIFVMRLRPRKSAMPAQPECQLVWSCKALAAQNARELLGRLLRLIEAAHDLRQRAIRAAAILQTPRAFTLREIGMRQRLPLCFDLG